MLFCRNVQHLLEDLTDILDTPSKRTLWFYIIPLLSPPHQTYCQRRLGLPEHVIKSSKFSTLISYRYPLCICSLWYSIRKIPSHTFKISFWTIQQAVKAINIINGLYKKETGQTKDGTNELYGCKQQEWRQRKIYFLNPSCQIQPSSNLVLKGPKLI